MKRKVLQVSIYMQVCDVDIVYICDTYFRHDYYNFAYNTIKMWLHVEVPDQCPLWKIASFHRIITDKEISMNRAFTTYFFWISIFI